MGVGQWMKVIDTVSSLAQMGAQFRRPTATDVAQGGSSLEHRLAGVVVAALKEAFDRDRARMDLERETLEAERSRAERALQAELRRQAADRALTQIKLISIFAGLVVLMSSVLAAWISGMRSGPSAVLLSLGWAMALGTLGCVFAAWQDVTVWASATEPPPAGSSRLAATAPWLLLASLVFVAVSLLLAG
ncbi:MAG: hypothetical protein H0W08_08575 [Acidobacteria bacterium]|nr:hypothetical protein [Acidobacteriota bacterium]